MGSAATQIFAEASKSFDGITFGIFTMPFKFEGKTKQKIAVNALRELRRHLNVSIVISNEKIFKVIDSNVAITDAFSTVNKNLIESLESLIDLIYNPGIINIDFADLRAILKGKGNFAFLNSAQASGKDRADIMIKKILHNPLYQSNNFKAEKILFNITGSNNISMFEVDKISKAIAERNPNAKIIFGISKGLSKKNQIKATLLMTGSPDPSSEEANQEKTVQENKEKPKKDSKIRKIKKAKKASKLKDLKAKENEDLSLVGSPQIFDGKPVSVSDFKKLSIMDEDLQKSQKKVKRRNALEVKKALKIEEDKRFKQEEEWEIPTFLRKFNKVK